MDIKDCGIKTPAELSIRHSDISVGKGVTGKSAIPYETAQCSACTEFPVLASPHPFSCFYAALQRHTSICTSALRMATRFPLRDTCPLAVSCTPTPARISAACSLFPARPLTAHARSLFPARPRLLAFLLRVRCSLHDRSLRTPARCFLHAHTRSLFPTRPRPLAFPLHIRCSPHDCSLCTPARCFPHAVSLHCVSTLATAQMRNKEKRGD
ncbi:hypothetical protein B0H13DRAFT_2339569 [Mycena leptocephala]|nr:hypothetical protein B0H13DRAFT_2339569 [Mycena leptocephala]